MDNNLEKSVSKNDFRTSGKQIQSVQRAISILNCFSATNTALTLSQIAARLNLNKGTVHGILNTLYSNGYISQNGTGQYMLGAEIFNKALLAADTHRRLCIDYAHDTMQKLSNRFQANSSLFAVEDGWLQMLDSTEPTNCMFVVRRAVSRISLHGSASGKILLTYLPEREQADYLAKAPFTAFTDNTKNTRQELLAEFAFIREKGYSYENSELFMGVSAIAVPIFSSYGRTLFGTISLTSTSLVISKHQQEIIRALADVSQNLQNRLQF